MVRPDWPEYFMDIARAVARRADCTRSQVGAVLVSPDHRIVSTGYNGAPSGEPGCLSAGACVRGMHRYTSKTKLVPHGSVTIPQGWCACGAEWPCELAAMPGRNYSTGYGSCISIHAEANCLLFSNRADCHGATLYSTRAPCSDCTKLIKGARVAKVVYLDASGNLQSLGS